MDNKDQMTGKIKQAAADLTDDKDLRREGKADEKAGDAKELLDDTKDKMSDLVDKAKDSLTKH